MYSQAFLGISCFLRGILRLSSPWLWSIQERDFRSDVEFVINTWCKRAPLRSDDSNDDSNMRVAWERLSWISAAVLLSCTASTETHSRRNTNSSLLSSKAETATSPRETSGEELVVSKTLSENHFWDAAVKYLCSYCLSLICHVLFPSSCLVVSKLRNDMSLWWEASQVKEERETSWRLCIHFLLRP